MQAIPTIQSMRNDGEPPAKMRRGEGPQLELRFLIPTRVAGVLIGKGGERIKKIREDYAVKVSIPDSNGPERILIMEGDLGSLMEILHESLSNFEEWQLGKNQDSRRMAMSQGGDMGGSVGGGVDLRLLVHQSQAGCIIGRAGYKIKELREQSGLRALRIYQMLCPLSTDRVVQLIGEVDKVLNCLQLVAELLEGAPAKGSRQNYDARNVDENAAAEYGGWGIPGSGLSQQRQQLGAGGGHVGFIPQSAMLFGASPGGARGGGGSGGGLGALSGGIPQASAAAMLAATGGQTMGGISVGSPGGDMGGGAAMMRGMPGRPGASLGIMGPNAAGPTTTTQVSVHNRMIGAIMGRGGCRIQQVRVESGADIKIQQSEPGVEDRIITITGTPEQIQNAQYLLQMCVKKYGDPM